MCYYDNNPAYGYTGGEVTSIVQRLAPAGYHILTEAEALQIAEVYDGNALKESGTGHWNQGNTGTNESLITLLGAGYREEDADFDGYREESAIWLADEGETGFAKVMQVIKDSAEIVIGELLKGYGLSVRLAMDNPKAWVPGMTVSDRDGNIYDLVRVYRGEAPTVVNYGLLYNWYAATDERLITSTGFSVATSTQLHTLISTGIQPFIPIDQYLLPSRGNDGVYVLGFMFKFTKTDNSSFHPASGWTYQAISLTYQSDSFAFSGNALHKMGCNVLVIKDSPTSEELLLDDYQFATPYIGNDGKIYRTVKIGTQVWLADNLAETKFRNGDYIPGFDGGVYTPISNAAWAALTTPACCAYDDDLSNAFTGSPEIDIVLTKQNWASTKFADGTNIELAQEEEDWIDGATTGKYCNYDDLYE
jgi:uncharacterized protein (TIGR02145 family)